MVKQTPVIQDKPTPSSSIGAGGLVDPFHHAAEGISCSRAAGERAHMSPRVRDLHARADTMFRGGYLASGWRLRQMAWSLEGRE